MKHEFFIKRKIRVASLVLLTLILPVGNVAAVPEKETKISQDKGLKETAADRAKSTLKACLYRIPFNSNLQQQKLAEDKCHKIAVEGLETSSTN